MYRYIYYLYLYLYIYIYTYIYTYIHIYTYIYTYIYTHKHTETMVWLYHGSRQEGTQVTWFNRCNICDNVTETSTFNNTVT